MPDRENEGRPSGRRKIIAATGGTILFPFLGRTTNGEGISSNGEVQPPELAADDGIAYVLRESSNPVTGSTIRKIRDRVLSSQTSGDLNVEHGVLTNERTETDTAITGYAFAIVDGVPIEYFDYAEKYRGSGGAIRGDGILAFLENYASGELRSRIERSRTYSGPGYDWNLLGIITKGPRTYTRGDYPPSNSTIGKLKKRIEVWQADVTQNGKRNYHCITRLQSEDGNYMNGNIWTHSHSTLEQEWSHGHSTGLDLHNIEPNQNDGTETNISVGFDGITFSFDVPYFTVEQHSKIDERAAHKIGYPARMLKPDAQGAYIEVGNSAAAWMEPPDSDYRSFLNVHGNTTYYSPDHDDERGFVTAVYLARLG